MLFHEQLAALRRARGISQETLAEQLGVSRQAVSKWETGSSQPELGNILALCRILDVSPNELLGDTTQSKADSTTDAPSLPDELEEGTTVTNTSQRIFLRNIFLLGAFIILIIILGISLQNKHDRGMAPDIESCYIHETQALEDARSFTLKITYDFLPKDQTNEIFLRVDPHSQDIYQHQHKVIIEGNIGYVTFLLPYGAECTVQHNSNAKKRIHAQDILKITSCTKDDYNQELLVK